MKNWLDEICKSCNLASMVNERQISDIEARARKAGYTIDQFCAKAGLNPSTWHRWKQGKTGPTMKNWAKVKAALATLEVAE